MSREKQFEEEDKHLRLKWEQDFENGKIQFGHVVPVKSDEYMTRGLNIVPMTMEANTMQGDRTPEEFDEWIDAIYNWRHNK